MAKLYVNSEWTNNTSITISDQSVTVSAAPSNGIGAYKTLANALTNSSNGDTVYIVASKYPGAGASTDNIFRNNTPPKKSITVTTSNAELTGTDPDTSINLGEIDIDNIQLTFSAIKASTQQLKLFNNTAVLLVENGSDLTLSKFSNPSASSDTQPSAGTVIVRDSSLTFTDIANNGINCAITLTNSTLTSMKSATKINHRPLELDTASKFIVNGSLSGSGTISIVVKDAPVASTTYTLVETTGGLSSFLSSRTVTLTVFGYEVTADPFTDGYTFGTSTDNIHFVLGTDANSKCLTLTATVTGAGMPSRDTVWISAEYDGTPGSTVNDHVVSWNAGTSTSVISSTTSQVYFTGGNETSYGDLDLSDTGAAGGVTISEEGTGTVSLGALTTGTGGVAVNGASLSFSGAIMNSTALTVGTSGSEPVTGSITAGAVTNSTDSTITVNSGSTLNANGTFSNSGAFDVFGTVANTELGTLSITNVSGGSVSVKSGGSLTANGGVTNSGSITVNGSMSTGTGAVTNNTGSTITVDNGGSLSTGAITNSSNLNVGTSSTATGTLTATSITNNADSTITVNSGSMLNANGTFSNSGAFDVFGTVANTELGTLSITNVSGGSVSVKSGGSLTANGGVTNSGSITVNGSMSTGTGAVTNNTGSTITVDNGGSLSTGGITNKTGSTITLRAGSSLNANGTLANSGTVDVYGTVANTELGTLSITNTVGSITVKSAGSLTANGTITNSASGTTSAKLNVYGTLTANGAIQNIVSGSTYGKIYVYGTLKTNDNVTNSGAISVGAVSDNVVTYAGSFTFGDTVSGKTLTNNTGSTITVYAESTLNANGTIENSGTINVTGTMNSTGSFVNRKSLSVGSSTVATGTLTASSLTNWTGSTITVYAGGSLTASGELVNNANAPDKSYATITVKSGGSFSADTITNKKGATFRFVYDANTTVSVANFTNESGGTIEIDITEFMNSSATTATIEGFTVSNSGTIKLVSNGQTVKVNNVANRFGYQIVDGKIVLNKNSSRNYFVNAQWAGLKDYTGADETAAVAAWAAGLVEDGLYTQDQMEKALACYASGKIIDADIGQRSGDIPLSRIINGELQHYRQWTSGSSTWSWRAIGTDVDYLADQYNASADLQSQYPDLESYLNYYFYQSDLPGITYGGQKYDLAFSSSGNYSSYANAFGMIQGAINASVDGDTIVFYNLNINGIMNAVGPAGATISQYNTYPAVADFNFEQGVITVDRDLTFRTGSFTNTGRNYFTDKAVKFDSIAVDTDKTATFERGVYSLEGRLNNTGAVVIGENVLFNADMVQNVGGTIMVDKSSRLVGSSIDEGVVTFRVGDSEPFKWIERFFGISVGNKVIVKVEYPKYNDQDPGWAYLNWTPNDPGSEEDDPTSGTFGDMKDIHVASKEGAKDVYWVGDNPPIDLDGYTVRTLHPTNEYGSLLVVDSSFDLQNPVNGTYSTAAIYVNKGWTTLPTDSFDAKKQNIDVEGSNTVSVKPSLDCGELTLNLTLPKNTESDRTITVKVYTSNDTTQDPFASRAVNLAKNKTSLTLKFYSDEGHDLLPGTYFYTITDGGVTSDPIEAAAYSSYVQSSITDALNSHLVTTDHAIGTDQQGQIIRIQAGTYLEGNLSIKTGLQRDVILESDKYLDENGAWQYDVVGATIGGFSPDDNTPQLITFSHFDNLMLAGNWQLGGTPASGQTSILNFVDIGNLTIRTRLKMLGGSTARIVNSNLTVGELKSNGTINTEGHLSVAGSTLIIEGSTVTFLGASGSNGVLSTENNMRGSGSVIVRNSVFKVNSTSVDETHSAVNLKINAEFIISGESTVDAIFTDLDGAYVDGTNTQITFHDAILGSDTNIRAGALHENRGAQLHFEGNNSLDGSEISQNGGRGMVVDAGSTLDMSGGATISLPDYDADHQSTITNNGIVAISDDSLISAHEFVNAKDSSLSVDAGSLIQVDNFTNSEGATVSLILSMDSEGNVTLPIVLNDPDSSTIQNEGTFILDASQLDYTDQMSEGGVDIMTMGGTGTVILKTTAGGEHIETSSVTAGTKYTLTMDAPDTTTLYVNGEWDANGSWYQGKNAGSYSYYNINAFKDNPSTPTALGSLKFTDKSGKVVYYGGNESAYGDLDLSRAANAPDELTLTSLVSMSKSKLTFAISSGVARTVSVVVKDSAGKQVEKQNVLVNAGETEAILYSTKLDSTKAVDYYRVYVDGSVDPAACTLAPLPTDRDTASMGALTVAGGKEVVLSGATMSMSDSTNDSDSITVNVDNTEPGNPEIGTLRVAPGETAKLVLDVADGTLVRDVQVKVFYSPTEWEIFACRVPVGEKQVEIASKVFALGKSYTVQLSDQSICKAQYVAGEGAQSDTRRLTVSVAMLEDLGRTVDISVHSVDDSKGDIIFMFKNQSIESGEKSLDLVPAFTDTDQVYTADVTLVIGGEKFSVDNVPLTWNTTDGKLELPIQIVTDDTEGASAGAALVDFDPNSYDDVHNWKLVITRTNVSHTVKLTADVTITAVQTLNYTCTLDGSETSVVLPTAFVENAEYSVLVTEPETTAIAVAGPISDSHITAQSVSNSGLIIVSPENEQATIDVSWIDTDGVLNKVGRNVEITVEAGTTSVGTYTVTANAQTASASITSCELRAGETYSISVKDQVSLETGSLAYSDRIGETDKYQTLTFSWTPPEDNIDKDRTVEVEVWSGETLTNSYRVKVAKNQSTAQSTDQSTASISYNDGFASGSTVKVKESVTYQGTGNFQAAEAATRKVARLVFTGLAEDSKANRKIEVTIDNKTYSVLVEKGSTTATLVHEDFEVGTAYTASIKDGDTTSAWTGTAETLSYFTAETVTNTGTIEVIDASFTAASVANSGSFNVSGYSRLTGPDTTGEDPTATALALTGTINAKNGATLADSYVSGGVISAEGDLNFAGSDTLTDLAVNAAANKTVTVNSEATLSLSNSTLTVGSYSEGEPPVFTGGAIMNNGTITLTVDASNPTIKAGTIDNTAGTIIVDTTGYDGSTAVRVIDVDGSSQDLTKFDMTHVSATSLSNGWLVQRVSNDDSSINGDIFLVARNSISQAVLYVNSAWEGKGQGQEFYYIDTYQTVDRYFGINAFSNLADALSAATSETTTITLLSDSTVSNSDKRYIAFGNSAVTINGAFDGEIEFASGKDLCLTPKENGSLVIADGTTISTVGDKSSAYIVLNYGRTNGTVTVNGTLDSSTEIALWGMTTVGTNGRLVSNNDGIILFRSGYTADAAVFVTGTGSYEDTDAAQIDATWFFLASGVVSVNGSKVNAEMFKFDQNLDSGGGDYTANADEGSSVILSSSRTEWTIGEIKANEAGITKDGEFVSFGDTITVSGSADFGSRITLSLNASDMTVGGGLTNAGRINVGTSFGEAPSQVNRDVAVNIGGSVENSGTISLAGSVIEETVDEETIRTAYTTTLTATGAVTNTGAINLNAGSTLKAASVSGGEIHLDFTGLGTTFDDDLYILVEGSIASTGDDAVSIFVDESSVSWSTIKAGNAQYGDYTLTAPGEGDPTALYLIKANASTLYVSSDYTGDGGTITDDGHMVGFNAFASAEDAATAVNDGSPADTIVLTAQTTPYGDLELSLDRDFTVSQQAGSSSATAVTLNSLSISRSNTTATTLTVDSSADLTVNNGFTLDGNTSLINDGAITVNTIGATPVITATDIANTSGAITINAGAYTGSSLVKVIDVDSDATLTLANISLASGAPSGVRLLQGQDKDIYVGIVDQSTLYVNNDWSTALTGEEVDTGKYYGINAFANITDSRVSWSGDAAGQDVRTDCVATNTIVFAADTYAINSKTYFYSNNKAEGVLIRGANADGTPTNVVLTGGRLYLTSAVTGDYTDANLAAKVGNEGNTPLYTIHKDLTLSVSRLNIGNAKDTSETTRTGGVANLAINGTLKSALYAAPYSTVTVNKSGNVDVLDDEAAWLQMRPNAVLTVNGSDGDGARVFGDDEYQFRQDALNFIDGGTVNLNNTKAHLEYIRMDSVGSEEPLTVQNDTLNVTDSILVFGDEDLTGATPGVVFGSLDHTNTMTVNLTRSTVTAESKDFNPLAGMTVNVDASTVTASAVTNSGTFNVSGESTLDIGMLKGTINLLNSATVKDSTVSAVGTGGGTLSIASTRTVVFSGTNDLAAAIDNGGSITVNGTLSSGAIDNNAAAASIAVNGTLNSGTISNSGVTASDGGITVAGTGTLNVTGNIDNDGAITVNGTLNVTGNIDNAGGTITLGGAFDSTPVITVIGEGKRLSGGSVVLNPATCTIGSADTIQLINGALTLDSGDSGYVEVYYGGNQVLENGTITVNAGTEDEKTCVLVTQGGTGLYLTTQTRDTLHVFANDAAAKASDYVFGYNAFGSITEALTVAQGLTPAANGTTTIQLESNVSAATLENSFLWNGGVEHFLGNVEIVGKVADTVYEATIPVVGVENPDYAKEIFLSPAENMSFTIAKDVTLASTKDPATAGYTPAEIDLNYAAASNAKVVVAGKLQSAGAIKAFGNVDVETTGTLSAGTLLWLTPGRQLISGETKGVVNISRTAKDSDHAQVDAEMIMITSGEVNTTNSTITCNSFFFQSGTSSVAGDKLVSTNTDWTITADFAAVREQAASATFNGGAIHITSVGRGIPSDTTSTPYSSNNVMYGWDSTDGYKAAELAVGTVNLASADFTLNLNAADLDVKAVTSGARQHGAQLINVGTINVGTSYDDVKRAASITLEGAGSAVTNSGAINLSGAVVDSVQYSAALTVGSWSTGDNPVFTGGAITNTGALNLNVYSLITAASIDNDPDDDSTTTNGTITIDATAYAAMPGMKKVFSLTTDDGGALASQVNFTAGGLSANAYYSLVYKQTDAGCDYFVTDTNQTTLYVNNDWNTYTYGSEIQDQGQTEKYYDYNAFSQLNDEMITYLGEGVDQTAKAPDADTIVFNDGDTYNTYNSSSETYDHMLYYAVQDTTLTGSAADSTVTIKSGQFYLMEAVSSVAYTDDDLEDMAAATFTVDGLTIDLTAADQEGVLKVGDVQSDTRTAGIGNLVVGNTGVGGGSGEVNGALYVAPYSTVTVNSNGKVIDTRESESVLRQNAELEVNGVSGEEQSTDSTTLQLQMNSLSFLDGGTLSLTDTRAVIGQMQFGNATDSTLDKKNASITLDNTWLDAGAEEQDFFGTSFTEEGKTVSLNILNGSTLNAAGTFNPDAKTTVTLTGSELGAAATSNSGTISVTKDTVSDTKSTFYGGNVTNNADANIQVTDSAFIATSLTNSGSITVSGSDATFNVPATRSAGEKVTNNDTITVKDHGSFFAGSVRNYGLIDVKENSLFSVTGAVTNYNTITVTDSTFEVGGSLKNNGDEGEYAITVTNSSFQVDTLLNNYQMSIAGSDFTVVNAGSAAVSATVNELIKISSTSEDDVYTGSTVSLGSVSFGAEGSIEMDWRSTLTFTGFGDIGIYANKLTLDMDGCNYAAGGRKKLLDSANDDWTEEQYRTLLTNTDWKTANYTLVVENGDLYVQKSYDTVYVSQAHTGDGYFDTVAKAVAVKPSKIMMLDGTYSVSYFNNYTGEITGSEGAVGFGTKNVYAGMRYTAGSVDASTNFTIHQGTYNFVSGGGLVSMADAGTTVTANGNVCLTIKGGDYKNYVLAGADKVSKGTFYRTGNVTLTIEGGSFEKNVGAGIIFSGADNGFGSSTLTGTITTVITGGSFSSNTWFYGGNFSNSSVETCSGVNTLVGSTKVTIGNNTGTHITLGNVAAGSHGFGWISKNGSGEGGNTELVFTGNGANLTIAGKVWGGCTSDYYSYAVVDEETVPYFNSRVSGNRTLSFTGFNGELNCAGGIKDFSHITFTGSSEVSLNNPSVFDLSEITNWTFEYGSTLSGNFKNDFGQQPVAAASGYSLVGDTMCLTGLTLNPAGDALQAMKDEDWKWTVLENSCSDAFHGFGTADFTVYLNDLDHQMSLSGDVYTGSGYKLSLDTTGTKMILTLA